MSLQRFLVVGNLDGEETEFDECEGFELEYEVGFQGELIIQHFPILDAAALAAANFERKPEKYLTVTINSCDWTAVSWGSRNVAGLEVVG